MKLKLILAALMFFSLSQVFAQEGELSLADQYTMMCGDLESVLEYAGAQGEKPTKADIAELNESRVPLLKILKTGAKGIQEILDEGSKSDTGPFGAIMACSMLVQIKSQIKESGCTDLATGKRVSDKGGIAACAKLLKGIKK